MSATAERIGKRPPSAANNGLVPQGRSNIARAPLRRFRAAQGCSRVRTRRRAHRIRSRAGRATASTPGRLTDLDGASAARLRQPVPLRPTRPLSTPFPTRASRICSARRAAALAPAQSARPCTAHKKRICSASAVRPPACRHSCSSALQRTDTSTPRIARGRQRGRRAAWPRGRAAALPPPIAPLRLPSRSPVRAVRPAVTRPSDLLQAVAPP